MIRYVLMCAAATLAINGCAQKQAADVAKPISARGQLEFLGSKTTDLYANLPQIGPESSVVGQSASLDVEVGKICGLTSPDTPTAAFLGGAIVAAAASVAVGWAIDYLISQASVAAQKRVAEYSALTSGGLQFGSTGPAASFKPPESIGFYSKVSPPTLAWTCLRFSHKMTADKGGALAMEAIFKVEVAASQDSLVITPLRLYFDRPVARTGTSKDSTFGVSLGATFDALWQAFPTGEGKTSRVWSPTLLSQKIVGINWKDDSPTTTRQRFYYYNVTGPRPPGDRSDASNTPMQVPLVPWSVNRKAPYGSGTLAVSFAEVGDPPAILEFVAGLLKDHGKEIGDFLKDAAKKAMPTGE